MTPSGSPGVILLAAGGSPGTPDALQQVDGGSALSVILRTLAVAGLDEIVVVLGESRPLVESRVRTGSARLVGGPEGGRMIDSIRAGLEALEALSTGAMIFPVNHALVSIGTLRALAAAHVEMGGITIPVCDVEGEDDGRRGHPVVFAREFWGDLRSPLADPGAAAVVHARAADCHEVRVLDRGILVDLHESATQLLLERTREEARRRQGGADSAKGASDARKGASPRRGPGATRARAKPRR